MKEEKITSIIKNSSSKNAVSGKISIPNSWLIQMGIDIENKEKVKLLFDSEKKSIIITANEEKEFEKNSLTDKELIEIIKELIEFIDNKIAIEEKTTKGCGELKYPIYSNKNLKNEFIYNGFVVKGNVGKGSLSKENVGIYFLKGDNKISDGSYIFLNYLYLNNKKENISVRLGSSTSNTSGLSPEKKKKFNKYSEDFNSKTIDYHKVLNKINELLNKYNKNF